MLECYGIVVLVCDLFFFFTEHYQPSREPGTACRPYMTCVQFMKRWEGLWWFPREHRYLEDGTVPMKYKVTHQHRGVHPHRDTNPGPLTG